MREHLATLLDDFRRYGREIAVVHYRGNRRRTATYAEIARLAGRFAALLERRDVLPGDRVVLWAENGTEWVAAFYGIMLRGALAVPLDAYGSADFAARVTADVKPKIAVGDALLLSELRKAMAAAAVKDRKHRASASGVAGPLETLAFEDWATSLPADEAAPVSGLNHNTPLQILFTSGTTGEPKGIVHTHGNVLASVGPIEDGARPYMRYEKLAHPLRFLHTLPLSHVFGQTMGLWVPAIFAAEVHFESRLVAPKLIETIKRERISVLAAVPRVIALVKTHLENTRPGLAERVAASKGMKAWKRWWVFRDVHRAFGLKFWALVSGGGALAAPLEQFWNALGFVVVQGYGMTETTALITLNHPFHVARGTIGKPLPGREVKIGADGEVLVKGPMISRATWSGGHLQEREDEWLATGDLAEQQATGELRFLGRKSETIVTAAGVNVHPEDLEAALEQEPGISACAVVAMETPNGPEPCAVLAVRGAGEKTAEAVERANARLADFQRVRRWVLWPEPDLPRTSTGKVRRKAVEAWLHEVQAAAAGDKTAQKDLASAQDWLLALINNITGGLPKHAGDESRLVEDLGMDSLGRVQLDAALEDRLGGLLAGPGVDEARTLGELRAIVEGRAATHAGVRAVVHGASGMETMAGPAEQMPLPLEPGESEAAHVARGERERVKFLYPHWPWGAPVQWARAAFLEAVAQPLVWLLAHPRVVRAVPLAAKEPMLIVCNHVTAFDGPLVEYALPGSMRRRVAVAMLGEMLEDYRHFRNPDRAPGCRGFMLLGPLAYLLVTALFNVFPLPRQRDFQRSFVHAGEALDRGFNVLVFPEGTRSTAGELARFRPGIGILVKQSGTAVLPVAIRGLGELKARGRGWFRSGTVVVHVGEPMRFGPGETEEKITEGLHAAVERLLHG
ncbi:MAG TPA: AMP-binding protein [Terracidiphilus sp.]|nr:AMP-binding protein [Terracidiphilus sp.]